MLRAALIFVRLFFICSLLFTSGCTSEIWDRSPPPGLRTTGAVIGATGGAVVGSAAVGGAATPLGALIGGVWGFALGGLFEAHQSLIDRILYNGVQVVRIGDEIMFILPSDRFFYPDSPTLNPNYYPVLNMIAEVLRCVKKIDVKVAAYTDNCGSMHDRMRLTKLQADNLVNYLWAVRTDTRLLYSVGYGSLYPIATNITPEGRRQNRRVEITLRVIVPKVLV